MTTALLAGLTVGEPTTHSGVTLYPVFGASAGAHSLTLAPSADGVVVRELDEAEVPTLVVTNPGDAPVLLVDGEILEGGRQTRTLNVSVLVAGGATTEVPVSCVEAGRWSGRQEFTRSRSSVSRSVRSAKNAGVTRRLAAGGRSKAADQGEVWDRVGDELRRREVVSASMSYLDFEAANFDRREGNALGQLLGRLVDQGPQVDQTGLAVAVDGRVVAAEVFATPDLLAARWAQVLRSLLAEDGAPGAPVPAPAEAREFLRRAVAGAAVTAAGVGLGTEHHFREGDLVAQALVWEDVVVHASLFALAA